MATLVVVLASFFMPRNDDQEFVMLVSIPRRYHLQPTSA